MSGRTQEALVVKQFGAQASAYLASAVHAGGEDLAALAALAHGRRGARVLDMGTGGGHVAYAMAPHVARSGRLRSVGGDVVRGRSHRGGARTLEHAARSRAVPKACRSRTKVSTWW